MYQQLASRLDVDTNKHYSQPVSMQGANHAFVEATVFNMPTTGNLTIWLEQSNDLENWSEVGASAAITAAPATPGYYPDDEDGGHPVAAAYVRLKYSMSVGDCIISAGLNTSSQ